jgi:alkylation response protein AidB-like acyl-CoA dehydrogenase
MDFRHTEEQLALQDTLQRFISRDYDFEQRRALTLSPLGYSPQAWAQYAELGLLGLPLPEEYGGLSGTGVDIMLVMESVGQGLLLEPYWSTVVLCGGLIRDAASPAIKQEILPQIAEGTTKLAFACYEAQGRYDLEYVACSAARAAGGWQLSGKKSVVLDAPSADYLLVSARTAGARTEVEGVSLFLVRKDAPGVSLRSYPTQSGGRAADVELKNVAVGEDSLIGSVGQALNVMERAVDLGVAALCAEALGIMVALNQATLNYTKTRKQFGLPIGSFQALQHRMADMFIATEQTRSMAIVAAMNATSDDAAERRRAVSGAKAYVGQASRFVGQQAVQLHGAMGVVDEVVVSHYFKRLTMIDMTFGDADHHLGRVSDLLR